MRFIYQTKVKNEIIFKFENRISSFLSCSAKLSYSDRWLFSLAAVQLGGCSARRQYSSAVQLGSAQLPLLD